MSINAGFNYPDNEGVCLTHGSEVRVSSGDSHDIHSLSSRWPGLGFSSVDAGLLGVGNRRGKFYLFSGDQYMRFDIRSNRVDQGYPRPIRGNWPIPFNRVDAAWIHPLGEDKYYLSSGSKYVRLSQNGSKPTLDRGFPQTLKDHWKGVDFARIDGAVQGRKSENKENKMYFFSGEQYLRYDLKNGKVDNGYPRSIAPVWNLPASWKPKERKVKVRLLNVKCHGTEDGGWWGSNEDELTILWGGLFENKAVKGVWRLDGISDRDTKHCPANKTIMFDGTLPENSPVEILVSLIDRDNGGGGEYRKIFDGAFDAAAAAGVPATAVNPVVGGVITGVASAAKAIGLANIIGDFSAWADPDDDLGQGIMVESTSTLPIGKKVHELRIKKNGGHYMVRIQTEAA